MAVTLNSGVVFKAGASSLTAVDLSAYVAQITLDINYDQVETTGMQTTTPPARTFIAGLQQATLNVTFNNEYSSASGVNQVIGALVGSECYVEMKPSNASVSASNPKYSGNVLVTSWTPINGAPGDLATVDWSVPFTGKCSIATS